MAGTLTVDNLKSSTGVLATQNGMTGIAKAWVKFAGATGTITGSFNVSSIIRNAAGDYTVNFSTALPSAAYSFVASCGDGTGGGGLCVTYTYATGSARFRSYNLSSVLTDFSQENAAFFA